MTSPTRRLPTLSWSLAALFVSAGSSMALGCGGRPQFNPPVSASSTHSSARSDSGSTSSNPNGGGDLARGANAPKASSDQNGLATWYGGSFAGKKTANGEVFDPSKLTAAHRKLPFGTWVEVRRPETGRSVRVRINDRGPFGDERRVIDLSRKAAEELDLIRDGVAKVELRVVDGP